ncbi:MAG: MFS transporter [Acidimicrobiales bacterium]
MNPPTATNTGELSGTPASGTPASGTPGGHRLGLALVVIAAAQLMVMLDLTIVNIALPSMQRELGFSSTNLAWVINAYVLAFGGLLLLGGRTGDLFGRRRMFIVGVALFTTASLAGGLATDQVWLIVARSIQGIGAAIASPTALALVATTFPEGPRRHKAMAVYAGMSGAGAALGLLLGGILVDVASWRWVLFVNVPIGIALVATAPFVLERSEGRGGKLDLPGALSVSAGMALIVYGLVRAPTTGWSNSGTIAAFAAGVALLIAFAAIESRSIHALLPLKFLGNRNRAGGYAVMLLLGAAMLSLIFFLTQFLQDVLHYSPIAAGVAYLPLPIVVGSMGLVVSKQVKRFGTRPFLVAGPFFVAVGLFWVSLVTNHSSYPAVFGPLVVVGLGMGLSFVPLTLNAITAVRGHESGLASALLNTSQQVGGSLGLAVLVTVAATVTRDSLRSAGRGAAGQAARSSVAMHAASLNAAVSGYQAALRAGAIGAAIAFVIALLAIRAAPPVVVSTETYELTSSPA